MAPTAAQLKEEGNALFVKKDFVRAHEKYTEAIAIDDRNAILYANRSACNYGMSKYLDASRDACKATLCDPMYTKGWSRLAMADEALLNFQGAIGAWKEALDVLSKKDLNPAELKQKEHYTASLQKTQERYEAYYSKTFPGVVAKERKERQPWAVAQEMLPELRAAGRDHYSSSAYVIHTANQAFMMGIGHLKDLKKIPLGGGSGEFGMFGRTETLAGITNGILRDTRVFRVDGKPEDWADKFNDQANFEAEKQRAWTTEDLEVIQKEALERLKKEGWDGVRPALSVVVRAWFMSAIIDSQVNQAPHCAVVRLKKTLELLYWGRRVWRDVSSGDRGVIFKDTFVRGVKAIYVDTLIEAHERWGGSDETPLLNVILKEARELIEDIKNPRPTGPVFDEPVDPGFVSSFYTYPAARAYAAVGYYFVHLGRSSENPTKQKGYYVMAVRQYTEAAQLLPPDDELFCWYLHYMIEPMLKIGTPKDEVMSIVKTIRAAMPAMQRIWGNSELAKRGRDVSIELTLRLAERGAPSDSSDVVMEEA